MIKITSVLCTILLLVSVSACSVSNTDFKFEKGKPLTIAINSSEESVTRVATEMFINDYQMVFNVIPTITDSQKADILIGTIGIAKWVNKYVSSADVIELQKHEEAFLLTVSKGKIVVVGSDKRGSAYGILELSRKIGVSPWIWWADATPQKKDSLLLDKSFRVMQYPSVARRGIFINDEDWGLMPWSSENYEPSKVKGEIGAATSARIFELLLRLRANTYWPAMHKCSAAFYETPGNKEMADKYGIFVGTSHCEPMMRNTNTEWDRERLGRYNYITNKDNILNFWEERVKQLVGSDNIYTLGLRGEHDGKMEGAKNDEERMDVLTDVLQEQRAMLSKYINPNLEEVSQVFIPYKEVLDAYRLGLEVPEDVTLMWCDDNYGYIRHFPTEKEAARKGGNGIYYHVSYWGRPHDYLWLATNHPAQIYTQMKMLYNKGGRDMWILNVGDIKPAEYLTEFFMDMAWNINSIENNKKGLNKYMYDWMAREFGDENAEELVDIMDEYYRLAYIRKPEYMGNTRTEERSKPHWNIVSDLPWSEKCIRQRIVDYKAISDKVIKMSVNIPQRKQSEWFELVEYPVRAAAEMNFKHLYGQLARHGLANWQQSDDAYDKITDLTDKYNSLENGKWDKIMDMQPRKLPVFKRIEHTKLKEPLVQGEEPLCLFNGNDYNSFEGKEPIQHGLGYQGGAVLLEKGSSASFDIGAVKGKIEVEVALAPNHPVDGKQIRYSISIDDDEPQEIAYQTQGRSEEWKENVLRNQAIRKTEHNLKLKDKHNITIRALDDGVVLDQIKVFNN
ncbi:MAG: glycosyl hydrolase 115 family protein [Mangrovibacterium sp.]